MKVRDLMTHGVETVSHDMPLQQAAELMRDKDIGFLAVRDGSDAVGTLTDRDIVVRAVASGLGNPAVGEVMSRKLATVEIDAAAEVAAMRMREHGVRRMIVLDVEERLCGVVSIADFAARSHSDVLTAATLADLKAPRT